MHGWCMWESLREQGGRLRTEEQVTAGLPQGAQGLEPSVEGHRLRQTMKSAGPWQFHSELVACGQAPRSCLPAVEVSDSIVSNQIFWIVPIDQEAADLLCHILHYGSPPVPPPAILCSSKAAKNNLSAERAAVDLRHFTSARLRRAVRITGANFLIKGRDQQLRGMPHRQRKHRKRR